MDANGPAFDAEQEVRFALVLYGGVSLAIYMYGIAEEFLHLVRATAPRGVDSEAGVPGPLAYPDAQSTEAVYRKLGRMLRLEQAATARGPGAHAVRRRRHLGHVRGRHQRRLPREGARQRDDASPG